MNNLFRIFNVMDIQFYLYYLLLVIDQTLSFNNTNIFTIHTEGCTISGFPRHNEYIQGLIQPPHVKNCSQTVRLVDSNSTHIWVIKDFYDYFNIWNEANFYCCYRNFTAINNAQNITYGNCREFSTVLRVKHEFVRVECYYLDDKMYDDFFLFKSPVINTVHRHGNGEYNVLILGIESMSRLNFKRTMPMTAEYLRKKGSVQLLGYNKLGDNSFPNLFPVLTGQSYEYVRKKCIMNYVTDINKCPFIWHEFKAAGYHTASGSDSPAGVLQAYEYNLPTLPTDFYLQPFVYESRLLHKNTFYNYHICMGAKYYYKVLLDYIQDLTTRLDQKKLFGFFWEESVSHENLGSAHIMDEDYFIFLKYLEDIGYLNKTIIMFLSDHGMRWGKFVRTKQGQLEDRLPLLEVLFPQHFRRRFKLAFKNFQLNSHRLATPFDIHKTLLDLTEPALLEDNQIRKRIALQNFKESQSSLFLPVARNRTCESLGIQTHWCSCYNREMVSINGMPNLLAARYLIGYINDLLKEYPQCHKLAIEKILEINVLNELNNVYAVVLVATPGGGIFDGTVVYERGSWSVSGTVSRLNLYRKQSYCINDYLLKMYCFCK